MDITILRESEIRDCLALDADVVAAVGDGFVSLAQGNASVPPIIRVDIPEHRGEVDVKTAYIHGYDHFAIKMASGFLDNQLLGLPYGGGAMFVVSTRTGFLEGVLLDNGYLTDVRTGAAGALAAQHLAPRQVTTAGVIGSGTQARYQTRGLKLVRDFDRLMVYGITPENMHRFAGEMEEELAVQVVEVKSPEEVVRQSDFVVTTTPSREPFLRPDWVHDGMHITCMGSDAEHKQELFPQVLGLADRLVCDLKSQCMRLGELHHAIEAGLTDLQGHVVELGEVISGRSPGRQSDDEITVCDLTGVGVQDTVIALLAYERASNSGCGLQIAA